MTATAFDLISAPRPFEDVACPEIADGATVRVEVMSGRNRDRWSTELAKGGREDFPRMRSLLLALTLVDSTGQRLFGDDQIDKVGDINGIVSDRLYRKAFAINRLGGDAVEEAAKN